VNCLPIQIIPYILILKTIMEEQLRYLLNHFFITTYIAAICGQMFSLKAPKLAETKTFLENFFPKKSETFYFRLNFLLVPIIGAFLGVIFFEPSNLKVSISAGLCWNTTLIAFLGKASQDKNGPDISSSAQSITE